MKGICFVYVLLLCLLADVAGAKVRLPSVIGNNMVLQQQSQVKLWGWSKGRKLVNVTTSWNNKKYQAEADAAGNWQVKVTTPAAGGPYKITFNDGDVFTISNVLIGEVWFCSGQSNMEMKLRGNSSPILNANEIILNADNKQLRLFTAGTATALSPLADCKGQWNESTSETAREFSALAFQYGEMLQKKLHVPVGIIVSSVGGTMIESWMSRGSLAGFPEVKVPVNIDTAASPHKLPTTLFNGMIAPFTNFSIKGFIWYQGESNRHEPALYGKLFPVMAADWRKQWGMGNLPFYYVQIAPCNSRDKTRSGPLLREAQLKAMSMIPNSGMASTLDVGMESYIHYMDKTKPAHRLGYWALGNTYGIKGIAYQAPLYKAMSIEGSKAILSFYYANYLTTFGKTLTLFEIAGADKKFHPAKASIRGGQVVVQSDEVDKPVAVRYAFKEFVVAELYNNDGLPASSFRTDDWDEIR